MQLSIRDKNRFHATKVFRIGQNYLKIESGRRCDLHLKTNILEALARSGVDISRVAW